MAAAGGGRSWWAHHECTRVNIELTIRPEKAEDRMGILKSARVSRGIRLVHAPGALADVSVGR